MDDLLMQSLTASLAGDGSLVTEELQSDPLQSDLWPDLSAERYLQSKLFRLLMQEMRRLKPHYFVVFSEFLKCGDLAVDRSAPELAFHYSVTHGFYANLGRRLGIQPNAVRYRLNAALRWFAERGRKKLARMR